MATTIPSILFCLINLNAIRTYQLYCFGAVPIPYEEIESDIMESKFYTMAFFRSRTILEPPPAAFIDNDGGLVKVTIMPSKVKPDCFYAYSLFCDGQDRLKIYVSKYIMDEEFAVFESVGEIVSTIYKKTLLNGIPYVTGNFLEIEISKMDEGGRHSVDRFEIKKSQKFRFAMIYSGALGTMRVYQTCDSEWTWLQISETTYTDLEKFPRIQDPFAPFLSEATAELKKKNITGTFIRTIEPLWSELFQFNYYSVLYSPNHSQQVNQFLADIPM